MMLNAVQIVEQDAAITEATCMMCHAWLPSRPQGSANQCAFYHIFLEDGTSS